MAEPTPIPAELELVLDFVNTADLETGADHLADPAQLRGWLAARGFDPGELEAGAVGSARALRESLRGLALANNGGRLYPVDIATLNRAAAECRLRPRFTPAGVRLEPEAGGLDGSLGRLVAAVYAAMASGDWESFKACADDRCRAAFFDATRNHSRTWCSMAVCGNRAKAKRFRSRRPLAS